MADLKPPEADGLVIPKVGPWSRTKHYYLDRYIHALTTSMTQKWQLHYIDLFAGAGIEHLDGDGLDWGSPLIAAQAAVRFHQIHLCELDQQKVSALVSRLEMFPQPTAPQVLQGDANKNVHPIVERIPIRDALTLAFLDPYGLHLDFATVRRLAADDRRIDFIIFFPDHLDALRNFNLYLQNPDSNLDRFFGTDEWRKIQAKPRDRWAEELRKLYEAQLRKLGYKHFGYKRIALPGGNPLYQLIFCSRHPLGLKIWDGISEIGHDGQRSLLFD